MADNGCLPQGIRVFLLLLLAALALKKIRPTESEAT